MSSLGGDTGWKILFSSFSLPGPSCRSSGQVFMITRIMLLSMSIETNNCAISTIKTSLTI